jgi:anti-sigma B factor antagonist
MDSVFEVDRSRVDGHAQVRFVGELDIAQIKRAESEVVEVLDKTAGALRIDLSGLTFCDAAGIGLLLRLDAETRARARILVLQHPTRPVRRVFDLVGVANHLTIEDGCNAR